ncbi:YbjN domain-containing protein [Corynebacterium camporealensis]|uniref:YbjN domain-containing protein n=1 Tax=Corynebacterium camporealensis TaxID=161896 RepID=UPI0034CE9092
MTDSSDPFAPEPSSNVLTRMRLAADHHRIEYIDGGNGQLIFPHFPAGETRAFLDPENPHFLHFYTIHRGVLGFSDLPALNDFVNDWNFNCLSPTAILDYSSPDEVTVCGRTTVPLQPELSDAQLSGALLSSVTNADTFLEQLALKFPETLTATKPNWDIDTHEEELTPERIAEFLPSIGIEKLHLSDEGPIYAWVNDVFFSFYVENGPTLNIKGHWQPELPPQDFTRVFLICNDWNRTHHAGTAYCSPDEDEVQVKIDYPVNAVAGLSDTQLRVALGLGMKTILHGIDDIALETLGTSPVRWP